jgi:mRNA interferase HicA
VVKQSEFVRWLARKGATFTEGKEHMIAHLNGEKAPIPRHPSKELKQGTVNGILKRLKLK